MPLLSSRESRRKATFVATGLLVLGLLGVGLTVLSGPGTPSPAEAEAAAKGFVQGVDRSLPMRINRTTTWTAVSTQGGEVRYTYRLADPLPGGQSADAAMRATMARQFCAIDPARDVMRRGVVFAFHYIWQGNETGRTVRVSETDCSDMD